MGLRNEGARRGWPTGLGVWKELECQSAQSSGPAQPGEGEGWRAHRGRRGDWGLGGPVLRFPKGSLKDEGESEGNAGLGARRQQGLLPAKETGIGAARQEPGRRPQPCCALGSEKDLLGSRL